MNLYVKMHKDEINNFSLKIVKAANSEKMKAI